MYKSNSQQKNKDLKYMLEKELSTSIQLQHAAETSDFHKLRHEETLLLVPDGRDAQIKAT